MRERSVIVIIACIVLVLLLLPQAALAGTVINVRPGLNGLYRTDRPVQLNISIANDGPALGKAVLEVRAENANGEPLYMPQNNAVYRKELYVPARDTADSTIIISGELAMNNPRVVLLVNGQEVAGDVVQGMAVSGRMVGISIGEELLSNGLPVWVDNNMDYLTLKNLAPKQIPADILGLMVADLIIISRDQLDHLTGEQVENIRRWVALGGKLLLSGGAGASKEGSFAGISPVIVSGETILSGDWGGIRAGNGSIAVARGTFIEGENQLVYNDIPLVARRNVGRGHVIYSAVDLENLGPGEADLWSALFQDLQSSRSDLTMSSSGSLVRNSANIPQLQLPEVSSMAGIWLIYIFLLAPGLYFLLKRFDRRDLAWFCIPAIAIATAVGMYYTAPFHRLTGPLGQTLAVVEILDDNVTEITAGSSFVLPRGGDLMLGISGQSLVIPENRYDGDDDRQVVPVIEYGDGGQEIYYRDVEFWSRRQLSLYKITGDFGQIHGEVQLDGDRITGTLKNNTAIDLINCLVVLGDKAMEVGELPAGKQVSINAGLNTNKFFYWEHNGEKLFSDIEEESAAGYVEVSEVMGSVIKATASSTGDFPVMLLIGYTNNLDAMVDINESGVQNYGSAMVKQRLGLTVAENGKFSLPAGFVPFSVVESDGGIEYTPDGRVLYGDNVKLEFDLRIPGQYRDMEFTTVDLSSILHSDSYEVKIYNWQNQRWEQLGPERKILQGGEIEPYISEQYRLRLSMQSFQGMKNMMLLPGLAVEGVIKND